MLDKFEKQLHLQVSISVHKYGALLRLLKES
jgi:hypothetical protein